MTTIAWDGKRVAVDSLATSQGTLRFVPKIFKLTSTESVVVNGPYDYAQEMLVWLKNGAEPSKWPAFQRGDDWVRMVVVSTDHRAWVYERSPIPERMLHPWAWGSGMDFAIAALACGKDAVGAVEIACRFDIHSGGEVMAYPPLPPEQRPPSRRAKARETTTTGAAKMDKKRGKGKGNGKGKGPKPY